MSTIIIFVAILAVLVLSHEFGHFIVARRCGIKVEEFGFGFPPRLFGVQIKNKKWRFVWGNRELTPEDDAYGTVYSLNWLPLGGFVKIKGEDGVSNDPDSFSSKPIWRRALVIVAGVFMNVVLAAALLSIGYMVGLPQMTDELPDNVTVQDRRVEIIQVLPGKPAETVGVKDGDTVYKVGPLVQPRLKQMQDFVNVHKQEEITFVFKRGEQLLEKKITPMVYADTGKGGIGVAIAEVGVVKYPWYKAIYQGIIATGLYLKEIVMAFYFLIKGWIGGAAMGEAVSGPVGIAVMTGKVARLGFIYLLQFTAVLSLNLAILNILPIPALDGGRLLFLGISKVLRRPVTPKYEQIAHTIGFMLLMLLVLVVTIKDISAFRGLFITFFHKIF